MAPKRFFKPTNSRSGARSPSIEKTDSVTIRTRPIGVLPARPVEMALEFPEMIVRKNAQRRAAQFRAIDEGRMTKLVEQDHVLFPDQCR